MLSKVRTCEREDPDDEDDHRDPAVREVVVPGVGVDDGPPPVDGDDDDRERRHQDVGACRKKMRAINYNEMKIIHGLGCKCGRWAQN